jgi:hypothetical protein
MNKQKTKKMGETFMKQCVLYDRECIECGECDRCDLDPNKICDNCMKCVNGDQMFRSILIDKVIAPENGKKPEEPQS